MKSKFFTDRKEDFKGTMKSYSFQAELEIIGINPLWLYRQMFCRKYFRIQDEKNRPFLFVVRLMILACALAVLMLSFANTVKAIIRKVPVPGP